MSAQTNTRPATAGTYEPPAEPSAKFTDLLAAEWIKLWSLRSIPWFILLSALATIGVNANAARSARADWPSWTPDHQAYYVRYGALPDAFTRPAAAWVLLAMGAVGAIAILSEQTSGLLRTTFGAVPARREVIASKVVVISAVAAGFGVLVVAVSFWLDEAILAGKYGGVSIGHPGALRLVAASALLAPVGALVGLALGAVIRHSVATMVTLFLLAFILPTTINDNTHLSAVITNALPFRAWTRLILQSTINGQPFPSTIGGAWTVYAVWTAVAVSLALAIVPKRDQ
ncbi:MAG: hypothetical protein JWO98_1625 [Frankiales bacterium]|nr:hypothetical protein [Frankiales bacterium]